MHFLKGKNIIGKSAKYNYNENCENGHKYRKVYNILLMQEPLQEQERSTKPKFPHYNTVMRSSVVYSFECVYMDMKGPSQEVENLEENSRPIENPRGMYEKTTDSFTNTLKI